MVDKRVTLDDNNGRPDGSSVTPQQARPGQQNVPSRPDRNGKKQSADTTQHLALPSRGGNISISATIDTTTIVVGEQKTLSITARRIDDSKPIGAVTFPTLQELTKGALEALEEETDTVFDSKGKMESITQKVTVTSFDQGKHPISHIVVKTYNGSEVVTLAPEDEPLLNVAYSEDADTTRCEMRPDVPHVKEPLTFWEVVRWVLLVLLACGAVLAAIWIIRRRKEKKPIIVLPKAKPVPADKKALSELESLRRKELWQKGRIKKYYTDLTDIVRRFLHNMYGISASEMTTRQTLRAFRALDDWSEESNEMLRQLLQKADMVKFAKSQPESHEHDLSMQNAIDFVRKVAEIHQINNPDKEGNK